ncbi:hypothetical protein CAPTEDRAFT_23984, partial [Capitella teleta]
LIRDDDPGDAVRVVCNNEQCSEGKWMHADCFADWEQQVVLFLRSCGRARSWSEKQRLQNVWTKKGYDLAYKACDCKCGCGHLRKDLNYFQRPVAAAGAAAAAAAVADKKQKRTRKPSLTKTDKFCPLSGRNGGGVGAASCVAPSSGMHSFPASFQRPQLRVRTSSFSSTGSSPPSSAGTPPLTPGGKPKFDFFTDPDQAAAGNIFRRRTDLSVFNLLPRHQQNPYHIKMEDEGPHGNDETRCFLLTNLSSNHVTEAKCVVCQGSLPVFDKYPLIDGTFFLSPQRYNSDLQVSWEQRSLYLNAVCLRCLQRSRMRCRSCKSTWDGSTLVIGTMYSYDVFAAQACCPARVACKRCRRPVADPPGNRPFSDYSKMSQCNSCHAHDFHFVRPL